MNKIQDDSWIQTASGGTFYYAQPSFSLFDIAHSLSLQTRFLGHCLRGYSIAEHSIHVCELVMSRLPNWRENPSEAEIVMAALTHDTTEAYIGDMPAPLKRLPQMWFYRALEKRLQIPLAAFFGIEVKSMSHFLVKQADLDLLVTEARDNMRPPQMPWGVPGYALKKKVDIWDSEYAKHIFLQLYAYVHPYLPRRDTVHQCSKCGCTTWWCEEICRKDGWKVEGDVWTCPYCSNLPKSKKAAIEEALALLSKIPAGEWTAEQHGENEHLFIGQSRDRHGLNIIGFEDPAYQWPDVKALILRAPDLLRALCEEEIEDGEAERK